MAASVLDADPCASVLSSGAGASEAAAAPAVVRERFEPPLLLAVVERFEEEELVDPVERLEEVPFVVVAPLFAEPGSFEAVVEDFAMPVDVEAPADFAAPDPEVFLVVFELFALPVDFAAPVLFAAGALFEELVRFEDPAEAEEPVPALVALSASVLADSALVPVLFAPVERLDVPPAPRPTVRPRRSAAARAIPTARSRAPSAPRCGASSETFSPEKNMSTGRELVEDEPPSG